MKRIFSVLTIVFLWCSGEVYGKDLERCFFRHYTIDDGLANNAVYSIYQDAKGFMWFGTIDGLHRFDGRHFKVFRGKENEDDVYPGNLIYGITGDDQQRLWVASDMGLALFSLTEERFYPFEKKTADGIGVNARIYGVFIDSKQNVWISTHGQGLFRYNMPEDSLFLYMASAVAGGLPSDRIGRIMEDQEGHIWVNTLDGGVCRYNSRTDDFMTYRNVKDPQILRNIVVFEDSQANIWIGNAGMGLFRLDKETGEYIHCLKPDKKNQLLQIRSIVEYRPGQLLLACDEGLVTYYIITGRSEILKADPEKTRGLNDNYLHALYVDREGGLWIGSYFGGINYISPTADNFFTYNYSLLNNSIPGKVVSAFCKDEKENLWIGTDDAGISYWNRASGYFTNYQFEQGDCALTYHNVHALLREKDYLWIGMYMGGLDRLDLKSGKFTNYKPDGTDCSLYSDGVYSLYKDSDGVLWVGTSGGLNRYDRETDKFLRVKEIGGVDVTHLLEDQYGFLWATTSGNGVYRLSKKTGEWRHYVQLLDDKYTLPTNKIITVTADTRGRLWLGTDGEGICRYDYKADRMVRYDCSAFPSKVIHKIIADNDFLWISSSNGLIKFQPEEKRIKNYNKYDGLQGNQFSPNAGIKMSDGTIYFGGINGFSGFRPAEMLENRMRPEIVLTNFQLFNNEVNTQDAGSPLKVAIPYTKELILNWRHSIFSLGFVGLSYTGPLKNQYAYRLEGFENEWTDVNGEPRVTYTNLPFGEYFFRVKAANSDGMWNEEGTALRLVVLPPFWLSSWAIGCYIVLGIALLLGLFYNYRQRWKKEHQKKLDLMAIEKEKELYSSKIEFFTHIIHEIRTPLTLILGPLEEVMTFEGRIDDVRQQLQTVERNGQRLLTLVNQLMDFRKIEAGGMLLNCVCTDVKVLAEGVFRRFVPSAELKKINCILSLPERSCYANVDPEALIKIISNLLSNALKFTTDRIELEVIPREGLMRVEICVKDNGQGISTGEQEHIFKPFYQIKETVPADYIGTGVGLPLIKSLTEAMQGELWLESELHQGAVFTVRFPLLADTVPIVDTGIAVIVKEEAGETFSNRQHLQTTILVVDDNGDLLGFLDRQLSVDFRVYTVMSGKEALELLQEKEIDLVVSDVMMPGMNGFELCKQIKTDIRTSHIPVLLLTARVDMESRIEGLENGGDVYVEKPFAPEYLRAQIHSLLANRERLRRVWAGKPLEPLESLGAVAATKADEIFIVQMKGIIEKHIADSAFSVEDIARELCMSRSGFFAKVKGVSGMTPNDFVRLARLKEAARLFSEGEMRVNEVCFRVGFTSPSYFAKCFQQQFGMSPTDFFRR